MTNNYAISYKVDGFSTTHTQYLSGTDEKQAQDKFHKSKTCEIHSVTMTNIEQVCERDDKIVTIK